MANAAAIVPTRRCPNGWARAGRQRPQPSERSCASRRSATPARLRRPQSVPAVAKTAQPRGDRSRGDRAKGDAPKTDQPRRERQPQQARCRTGDRRRRRHRGGEEEAAAGAKGPKPTSTLPAADLDADTIERRRGRERNGRPDRPLPDGCAGAPVADPGGRARRSNADRALRQPAGRRRQPDPRQHLRRQGAERAARHGGRVRRHRHPEERRAVPRRRAVRPRGHRREVGSAAHRADAATEAARPLPGHQEPDQRQGCPPHPRGVAAGSLRRADPQLEDLRHLQAPARRRAQAAAQHPRPGQAGTARPDRAHRRRERQRARARAPT